MLHATPQDSVRDYLRALEVAGQSPATIALRRSFVARWAAGTHPGDDIEASMITFLSGRDWSMQTRASAATSLRSWLHWARTHTDILRLPEPDAIPVPRVPRTSPRPLHDEAIVAALANCDDATATMILLGREAGLRRAEISQLHTDDLLPGGRILVHGKGGKQRVVPVSPMLAGHLDRVPRGWVFPHPTDPSQHVTPRVVGDRITRALPSGTAHQLRHAFATSSYAARHDVLAVQRLLGHSSVATTMGYIGLADEELTAVVTGGSLMPRQRTGQTGADLAR